MLRTARSLGAYRIRNFPPHFGQCSRIMAPALARNAALRTCLHLSGSLRGMLIRLSQRLTNKITDERHSRATEFESDRAVSSAPGALQWMVQRTNCDQNTGIDHSAQNASKRLDCRSDKRKLTSNSKSRSSFIQTRSHAKASDVISAPPS